MFCMTVILVGSTQLYLQPANQLRAATKLEQSPKLASTARDNLVEGPHLQRDQ